MYRITTLMVVQNVSALEKPNYVLLILLLNKHRYIRVCPLSACQGCIQVYSCVLPVSLSGVYTAIGIFVCVPCQPVRGVYRYIRVCPLSACLGCIQVYSCVSPVSLSGAYTGGGLNLFGHHRRGLYSQSKSEILIFTFLLICCPLYLCSMIVETFKVTNFDFRCNIIYSLCITFTGYRD